MITSKDFSEIATILKTNGVGFLKCFFESNQNPEELDKRLFEKEWILSFSDGKNYLGTLIIDPDSIGSMSTDEKLPIEMTCYGVECPQFEEKMHIDFFFTVRYMRGECIIQLPETGE